MATRRTSNRSSKTKKKSLKSSLVLLEPSKRNVEYDYTFFINLTQELVDEILEAAEDAEPDEYGTLIKLGGALYEPDEGKVAFRGSVNLRSDEEEERTSKRRTSKRRSRDEDEDYDDEEEELEDEPKRRTNRSSSSGSRERTTRSGRSERSSRSSRTRRER